ncbi:MAG TPA: hypothetical protein VFW78_12740 [Bacteroidia bacterium]|nr:hypothetical protein [Bacteroidia bacterium]
MAIERYFSRFLSYVLHPLLMPFYAVLILFNLNTYLAFSTTIQLQHLVLLIVFITTLAFPLLSTLLLLKNGTIQSLEMETARERRSPFLFAAVCYLICYYLLYKLPVSRLLGTMVLAAALTLFISLVLSFRYKVSIHMIGIGGLSGVLFGIGQVLQADVMTPLLICILVAGFLGTARLLLNAHSPGQIYSGFLIGFVTEWLMVTGSIL